MAVPDRRPSATEVRCVCGTSLTERDATFAVSNDSRVRIYSSSELFLLHEFSSIHGRILRMHHTTFCDAIVTLETKGDDNGDGDCYLCVYHDWRGASASHDAQKLVRAYTLPLAIADPDSICLSVCSFTGRVALASPDGFGVNIWQTSDGFFEHVMELKVTEPDIAFVAVHGAYVAVATATQVRVMEIKVVTESSPPPSTGAPASSMASSPKPRPKLWERKKELIYNTMEKDRIPLLRIPSLSGGSTPASPPRSPPSSVVRVMDKDDAQLEAFNLAGLVSDEDVRVNSAMEYVRCSVKVLLQRFVPPNHAITALRFLPETIDNRRAAQSRSYTRLLVGTSAEGFLYYFLADHIDSTRDLMAKKILQRDADPLRGVVEPIAITSGSERTAFTAAAAARRPTESGRVVMYYKFTAPVTAIAANSSFLFAATLAGLEVWSMWSPCHHVAAKKALDATFAPQPTQPQLLGVHPLGTNYPAQDVVALDGYVVVLTSKCNASPHALRHAGAVAVAKAHRVPFEMRPLSSSTHAHLSSSSLTADDGGSVLVFPQSPPSAIFQRAKLEASGDHVTPDQVDLLLSLFSLYRFRADVGLDLLQDDTAATRRPSLKDTLAVQLETKLYDTLARAAAAHVAHLYTTPAFRDLHRAALLYVASNVSSRDVLLRFRSLDKDDVGVRPDVIDATALYLEAFLFPKRDPSMYLGLHSSVLDDDDAADVGFTGVVLRHYGDHAPEQLSRLAIDSSLPWTLLDIDYCLAKLRFVVQKSVLIRMGVLVLLVRANGMPPADLKAFQDAKAAYMDDDGGTHDYSYDSIAARIEWLAENYPDPLIHLCVTHPELLVQKHATSSAPPAVAPSFYRSVLANGLVDKAPTKFLTALELVFHSALGHQNAVATTVGLCLGVLGDRGTDAAHRILLVDRHADAALLPFETSEVYVLCAVHFMLLHLIKHPPTDAAAIQASLAIEFVHLVIRLSLSPSPNPKAMLTHALASRSTLLPKKKGHVPSFVAPFLTATVGPAKLSHINQTLHQMYLFASQLVATVDAVAMQAVCVLYVDQGPIPTLMELLVLPRVHCFQNGLQKLHATPAYHVYLVAYAIAFSESLDDWRALLRVVLDPNTAQADLVLRDALDHLALTLSPEELLAVLPDDADAALFLDALERCVRKTDVAPPLSLDE
ncbi:Aste57867_15146 [Aphanomyces stellatus]|uniref:Aste57867_15146 protein n=1 Tax=Aphanomyces stellatus TaxID=120398 RepID=A0A485L4A0_9STRA|nr:hypothetical protein As57867_015090 [Aphanomyces stellatus]VFT91955.1 Aste57867_15146 [Aphanomyces stellatus]